MGLSKDIPSLETGTPNAAEVISIPTGKTSTEISVDDFLCGGWKTFQAVHGGCCQDLSWACLSKEPANKEIAKTPPQHISCFRINQEVTKERNTFSTPCMLESLEFIVQLLLSRHLPIFVLEQTCRPLLTCAEPWYIPNSMPVAPRHTVAILGA